MNIAFLFNSDDPKYECSYGDPIRKLVFGLGLIQASKRHMKISIGDVLIYTNSKSWDDYDRLTKAVYFSGKWSNYFMERLRPTFRRATVYALVFENITRDISLSIHREISIDRSYLGCLELDFSYGPHLVMFRNFMILKYRVEGSVCRIFYTMGNDDEKDNYELEAMREVGFVDVAWEDKGARKTIFDDFDTIEHFRKVSAFQDAVTPFLSGGSDEASQLIMVLEDLNPKLFDALGASVQALSLAQTSEEVAQAAISGRRYFEQLADVLFPPRNDLHNGHKVGRAEYQNRIWAYISSHANGDDNLLKSMGKEVDRLIKEFNSGLHADRSKNIILRALVDTSILTSSLLALAPLYNRKPYYAYEKKILEFFSDVYKGREAD